MLRYAIYGLYLLSPYILVYEPIFAKGFHWERFILFTVMLVSIRSTAADAKDLLAAVEIGTYFKNFSGFFNRLTFASGLSGPITWKERSAFIQEAKGDRMRLLEMVSLLPLRLLLSRFEKTSIVLILAVCLGPYISSYRCIANRRLSVVFVPDDPEQLACDPQRKFAILHELGHTHPANIQIFNRQDSETHIFGFILFIVILSHLDVFYSLPFLGIFICFAIVSLHLNSRLLDKGRLFAEIHADNTATRLSYLLDRPLFAKLNTMMLPRDSDLDAKQNRFRDKRFHETLQTYAQTGLVDNLIDYTKPTFAFSAAYLTFVYLISRFAVWGRGLENESFSGWWIFCIGALLMRACAHLASLRAKRHVLAKVIGEAVPFPLTPEEETRQLEMQFPV